MFGKTTEAVRKKLSACKAECTALDWNLVNILSNLKALKCNICKSLKAMSKSSITDGFSVKFKKSQTRVHQAFKRIFKRVKLKSTKAVDILKASLLESTLVLYAKSQTAVQCSSTGLGGFRSLYF